MVFRAQCKTGDFNLVASDAPRPRISWDFTCDIIYCAHYQKVDGQPASSAARRQPWARLKR
jgi:hypothetical protein